MSNTVKTIVIILLILLIDQVLKIWVKTSMMLGQEHLVLGQWFRLHFIENNGMAFGMEFAGKVGKVILSIFRIIAVIGIGWYLKILLERKQPLSLILSIAAIFAGALGNIIDSAFYGMIFNDSYYQVASLFPEGGGYAPLLHGKVVDMFYFPVFQGHYPDWFPWKGGEEFIFFRPVFNIADSAITLGVASILIFQKRFFKDL